MGLFNNSKEPFIILFLVSEVWALGNDFNHNPVVSLTHDVLKSFFVFSGRDISSLNYLGRKKIKHEGFLYKEFPAGYLEILFLLS